MKSVINKICLPVFTLLISAGSYSQSTGSNNKNKESVMSVIQKKETVRKLYEESLNKRNMQLLHDLVSENYVGPQGEKGPAGLEETVKPLINAFPDIQWKVEEMIGEGEKVMVRTTWQGTQTGPFRNFAATGKTIITNAISIYTFKNEKIISSENQIDRLGFLQGLGAIPLDLTLLSNKKATVNKVNFIDKFFVPAAAKKEFYERTGISREFIKKLPGFLEYAAYEYTDKDGNLICVTVARWENMEALNKAREAAQVEYKREGFDVAEMFKRLNIVSDRGVYTDVENSK